MRADPEQPCVLDNSIVMVWAFEDENDPYAMALLRTMENRKAIVPPLLIWEVTNVLTWAARKGRITDDHARDFLIQLQAMSIEIVQPRLLSEATRIFDLARSHGLTAYDAEYLYLALESGLPLATLDVEILSAMVHLGVERLVP